MIELELYEPDVSISERGDAMFCSIAGVPIELTSIEVHMSHVFALVNEHLHRTELGEYAKNRMRRIAICRMKEKYEKYSIHEKFAFLRDLEGHRNLMKELGFDYVEKARRRLRR